ncbi:flagellar basal body L-ring protein FlgH [Herbaspirillum sp. RTI4]|uniref:flagellar basal body L-ring protein FlgH n=1 Tax=Herbaspirillum sp. RTI4 TaxID=3048640 RepID=UPI002AB41ADF|nr:flagellar basal body L-ring protein FlgH [Herbaspirillum sp. RTI4]MDY7578302.1 flagellar basal body L-ring protein FlgH [Herbaspirillum sp. RTI4]MEA9981205.1 flagellar basal body L-ring protein FlgH [Herbaspirillum sp. RTI4]
MNGRQRACAVAVIALTTMLLAACNTVPESIVTSERTAKPSPSSLAPANNGAIFQSAAYRPMLEDRRARLVGDTLTIVIAENTTAVKAAGSSGSKTGSVVAAAPSVLGIRINELSASGSSANSFADKDATSSSNTFTGTIAVTVIDVMSNGNLQVAGEKQVALDKGVEYVRFSGVVSPDMIGAGNTVSSLQVADARVEYRTNNRIDAASVMSSLSRFFLSVMPF